MQSARFITLEGGEGAGKSTQLRLLSQALAAASIAHCTTREPGGSPGAEAIRALVVSGEVDRWHPTTEALLFMAARFDHLASTIHPALGRGEWVLCDRFYDSTYVYQGLAKQVGTAWLDQLYTLLYGNQAPDMTLLLDLAPESGIARATARGNTAESRFERMGKTYHEAVRAGFLALAKAHPQRIQVFDAALPAHAVHQQLIAALNQRFDLNVMPVAA